MKKLLTSQVLAVVVALSASSAYASGVGVDVNLHFGDRFRTVPRVTEVYRPTVVAYERDRRDCYTPEMDVRFVYQEPLDLYVAVGVPYDLCYIRNNYYLFRDGRWLRSSTSRGRWVAIGYRDLPQELRRHRVETIREYREAWASSNWNDRRGYRDRDYRDDRWRSNRDEEWREARRGGVR